jgi:hypothetical protein
MRRCSPAEAVLVILATMCDAGAAAYRSSRASAASVRDPEVFPMNWMFSGIKRIMLTAGVLTFTMLYSVCVLSFGAYLFAASRLHPVNVLA